jgi:hypothetical protein
MFGTHFQAYMAGVLIVPIVSGIFGTYWLFPLIIASIGLSCWIQHLDKQTGQV